MEVGGGRQLDLTSICRLLIGGDHPVQYLALYLGEQLLVLLAEVTTPLYESTQRLGLEQRGIEPGEVEPYLEIPQFTSRERLCTSIPASDSTRLAFARQLQVARMDFARG